MGNYFGHQSIVPKMPDTQVMTSPKERLQDQLNKLIIDNNYSNSIQLEENERGITIHIRENILFPPGRAELSDASKIVLNRIATVIKTIPNDIRIEGHTDNTPINTIQYPSNWHLSADRALNTGYYLLKSEGISPDKITIVGNGEYKPIAENDSPENRSKNRRVDIVILK
jgi:chemotaxis protein MotB